MTKSGRGKHEKEKSEWEKKKGKRIKIRKKKGFSFLTREIDPPSPREKATREAEEGNDEKGAWGKGSERGGGLWVKREKKELKSR